jgi:hypothetical protein
MNDLDDIFQPDAPGARDPLGVPSLVLVPAVLRIVITGKDIETELDALVRAVAVLQGWTGTKRRWRSRSRVWLYFPRRWARMATSGCCRRLPSGSGCRKKTLPLLMTAHRPAPYARGIAGRFHAITIPGGFAHSLLDPLPGAAGRTR